MLTLILIFSLTLPASSSPVLYEWLSSKVNFWQQLATKALNVSDFCLSSGASATDLFSTCLIGIPEPLEIFRNYTMFQDIPKDMSYRDLSNWGRVSMDKLPGMATIRLAHVPQAENCFQIPTCIGECHQLPIDNSLNCTHIEKLSHLNAHLVLPPGWFFLCGQTAYGYLPANTSQALASVAKEMHELREAVLDNRAAIDFLLLKNHYGCESVRHMCCFNLTDQTPMIHKSIEGLNDLASGIKETTGFDLSFLTDWLPSLDWLRKGFLLFLAVILFLLIISCCWSHLPALFQICRKKNHSNPSQQMAMLPLRGYNTYAVGQGRNGLLPLRPALTEWGI
ncbi:uncharacterized protein LOC134298545 [Anolis carolinensis]|uniref:uncharacterized protein LOC134298545 n=1 Tax=Anolis carolinensis TaxID=28377 RepID=UPI002F2B55E5